MRNPILSGTLGSGLLALSALLACGTPEPKLALEPLYAPPKPIPLTVGMRAGNSMASQLYAGPVIAQLQQMNLFDQIIAPFDATRDMDARYRLSVDRNEKGGSDDWVMTIEDAGKPIRDAFAKSTPLVTAHLPVTDVAAGRLGTLEGAGPDVVKSHARRMANALAQQIWAQREALIAGAKETPAKP